MPSSAAVLYELLLPYGDRVAVSYPEISTGSVARYLGLLAATMERWDDAERHFEDALEMNARIGARPWLAHTQQRLRADAPRPRRTRRHEKAQQLVSRALTTYRDLGMESYAASVPRTGADGARARRATETARKSLSPGMNGDGRPADYLPRDQVGAQCESEG